MPSTQGAFVLSMRCTGEVRCARTALAIERYRIDKGGFPSSLDDLVPQYMEALLLDPFDAKPLRYRLEADAAVVYTIGDDMSDDGGQVQYRTTLETPTDYGFVLLMPQARGLPGEDEPASTRQADE
jgi:hypothetical protein